MKPELIDKDARIAELEAQVRKLETMIEFLTAANTQLNASVQTLNETVLTLNQTIAELKEKLGKNSKNSSKPPSSDGPKKPAPKSLRTPSGKSRGGQVDHKGTSLSIDPAEITGYKEHVPTSCSACPHRGECIKAARLLDTRYVVDIDFKKTIVMHQAFEMCGCYMGHTDLKGKFPENVTAPIQYGDTLNAFTVTLNTIGAMSINRIHAIFSGAFSIPLSTGTIPSMVHRCAEKLIPTVQTIRALVIGSLVVHFDETGTRVDNHTRWVHTACTQKYTYLSYSSKRGQKGMIEAGVLPVSGGISVHDCWRPYWKFNGITHAVCNAHLLRELTGIEENHPEQTWPGLFKKLLLEMLDAVKRIKSKGKAQLSDYYHRKFSSRYDELMELAHEENPEPGQPPNKRGRRKKGKILALVDRLEEYKASVCLFTKDFAVPFDNNEAERSFRHVKTKTKVSGCFRSEAGVNDYVTIMSYVGTAQKHGIDAFSAILKAITGSPEAIFQGST